MYSGRVVCVPAKKRPFPVRGLTVCVAAGAAVPEKEVTAIYTWKGRINIQPIRWKLQTIILFWWFHSCYYLTETFAELYFFPTRHSRTPPGTVSDWLCVRSKWIWKAKFPWVYIVFGRASSAPTHHCLWFMTFARSHSLSAFRCRCYTPYTAICDGTLLKFHPHKY